MEKMMKRLQWLRVLRKIDRISVGIRRAAALASLLLLLVNLVGLTPGYLTAFAKS